MYKNQNEVDEIKRTLTEIDMGLKIGSYSVSEEQVVISVDINFPVKGKSGIIKKLESAGWRRTIRFKARTDSGFARNQYTGYEIWQRMTKQLS